jgi:hypothetical protein
MKKTKKASNKIAEIKISPLDHYGNYLFHYPNGDKVYYHNDDFHRPDGPAIEFANGDKYWYINGKYVPCKTQEEFERFVKYMVF